MSWNLLAVTSHGNVESTCSIGTSDILFQQVVIWWVSEIRAQSSQI
jgi:hypothetical protein